MAHYDTFNTDLGSRPRRSTRHRGWHIARRAALGLAGLVVLVGAGTGALTWASWHAPDEPGLAVNAKQGEAADVADVATASITPAGGGASVAHVVPARPSKPQRATKSDLLPQWPQPKRAAAVPLADPDPPILAARQVVAHKSVDAPLPQATAPGPRSQQAPDRLPAPETTHLDPQSEPESESASETALDEASELQAADAAHTAPVKTDVNMRAGPDNAAAVITVVPGGSRVEVIDCDYWCEVDFSGKRGWIYKSFIRGAS